MLRKISILASLAVLLFSVGWSAETKNADSKTQNQTFEILSSSIIGGEGVFGSSTNFKADFSGGQLANCVGASSNYTVYSGFWYTVDTTHIGGIVKGDIDCDGSIGLKDIVMLLNCTFRGIGDCYLSVADLNCTGHLSPADVVWILRMYFLNSPLPPC